MKLRRPPGRGRAAPPRHQPHLHAALLRYLSEIAQLGSIRRAAASLNVASSAINRQVLRFERELGVRIFDRMPSGMRPTPAGELLLRHVRATLQNFDRLLADMDGLQGILSGHVTLAALDSLLVELVPQALGDVARRYPAITFSALAASPAAVLSGVAAGDMDLGLSFVVPTVPSLQLVASMEAPLGCLMAPTHELASRKSLTLADLDGYEMSLQSQSLPAATDALDAFGKFHRAADARFRSNSVEFQRRILRTGLGIACLTQLGFQREIASGELVWVPLASPSFERLQIGLFIPANRMLSPAASQVVATLTRILGKTGVEA
ncbi:MAG: LysR family transcriptional regulator [Acetobacteraceae bacterium]|nr:LysR family transcriptional regulator [Acetobacteraceae bacterium]